MRTPVQQVTKAKGKQASLEDPDIPISYHGVAYVNMAPLLYPGVKRFVTADHSHTKLLHMYNSAFLLAYVLTPSIKKPCCIFFRIRGAYLVRPFIENEVYEKTKRKGALAEEAARVASGMSRTLASAMAQKTPALTKQGKADAAKTKVSYQVPLVFFTLYTIEGPSNFACSISEKPALISQED